MTERAIRTLAAASLAAGLLTVGSGGVASAAAPTAPSGTFTGTIAGADYKIEIPPHWNGDLLLFSHGYVAPGEPNPAMDGGDPATGGYLLSRGYALAGSSYKTTCWAVQDALNDQIALLDFFDRTFG